MKSAAGHRHLGPAQALFDEQSNYYKISAFCIPFGFDSLGGPRRARVRSQEKKKLKKIEKKKTQS